MDRYEEALKRAQMYYNNAKEAGDYCAVARYENIFPELAESEDERIRKTLVKHFTDKKNCVGDTWAGMDVNSVLAWLEKQKEQNPAEWSEEDRGMIQSIITNGCIDDKQEHWLRMLPERISQPEQEWSEEDEKMKERLITRLNWITHNTRTDGTSPNITFFDEIDWLKSLRPQQKVKLTELDENILEGAIAFVEQNDHFNYWRGVDKHTVLSALRSLRPQWKPSEEQMNELHYALIPGMEFDCDVLAELYVQLKKLKSDEK